MKNFLNLQLIFAGIFMGLANLVPGVSGGTMVYALGQYDNFIQSMEEITKFKFSKKNLSFLMTLFGIAFCSIILFSGIIQTLMESSRPLMLFSFIGLTLGGTPSIFKGIGPFKIVEIFPLILSFTLMALISFFFTASGDAQGTLLFFIAGVIGSSAMILPGISGSYLLLLMGCYIPIIESINILKTSLLSAHLEGVTSILIDTLIPFSLGIIVGIVALSNLLGYLLKKRKKMTELFLLGLLAGSLFGLWPFSKTPLSKLAKFAIDKEGEKILRIYALNDKDKQLDSYVEKEFNKLNIFVDITHIEKLTPITLGKIGEQEGIVLSFNSTVPNEFKIQKKTPIITLPDTSFTWKKFLIGFVLMIASFFLSFKLSSFKKNARS